MPIYIQKKENGVESIEVVLDSDKQDQILADLVGKILPQAVLSMTHEDLKLAIRDKAKENGMVIDKFLLEYIAVMTLLDQHHDANN